MGPCVGFIDHRYKIQKCNFLPAGQTSPPNTWDTTGYSQKAVGTHPAGMHSCWNFVFKYKGYRCRINNWSLILIECIFLFRYQKQKGKAYIWICQITYREKLKYLNVSKKCQIEFLTKTHFLTILIIFVLFSELVSQIQGLFSSTNISNKSITNHWCLAHPLSMHWMLLL